MSQLRILAFVLSSGIAAAQGLPLTPPSTIQDNGTIQVGRDPLSGGCITWLVDKTHGQGNLNMINDNGFGSQGQSAVFDTKCWNPTQAGDGPHAAITDVFYAGTGYVFSKCTPLLFYNWGAPLAALARPVCDNQIYMWTEFLNGNSRAFTVKALFRNTATGLTGDSQGQQITPTMILNRKLRDGTEFTNMWTYDGKNPWSTTLDTALHDVSDTSVHDYNGNAFLMTERWSALVDSSNWGLSILSTSSAGSTLFCGPSTWPQDGCPDDGSTDDHQIPVRTNDHLQQFAIGLEPNETEQLREGRLLCFVGDRDQARTFFAGFQPVLSGSFHEDFSAGDLRYWDLNSIPIQLANGGVQMGQSVVKNNWASNSLCTGGNWPNDMSLAGKLYGDAVYSVRVKYESGSNGWYGMAIRKSGEEHFAHGGSGYQSGYYQVFLTNTGQIAFVNPADASGGTVSVQLSSSEYTPSQYYTLSVRACGASFDVALNGVNKVHYDDPNPGGATYKRGYFSLLCSAGYIVDFDDVDIAPITTGCGAATNPDSQAPDPVSGLALSTSTVHGMLTLTWTNPTQSDWLWTRIVRKTTGTPAHWRDGQCVYEGRLAAYTDADVYDTSPSSTYYYAVYTVDKAGNYSTPVTASGAPTGTHTLKIRSIASNAADDGYISTNMPGVIDSTSTTFPVGDTAANHNTVAILSFDTTQIPTTAVIQSVKLKMKCSSLQGTPDSLGNLQVDIKKGFFGNQALEGSDLTAAASATSVAPLWNPEKSGLMTCALLDANGVQNINAGGWTQFRVSYPAINSNSQQDAITFYTGNSTAANQPVLEIVYY